MGTQVSISHRTTYRYDREVRLGPQLVRLKPAAHSRTRVLSYSLQVGPEPHFVHWLQDPYGNFQARVTFPHPVKEFRIAVDLVADLTVFNPFDFFVEPWAETLPYSLPADLRVDLAPYLVPGEPGPLVSAYLETLGPVRGRTVDFLVEVNRKLAGEISYRIRMEPNVQDAEQTLAIRSGSCRDSAVLLVDLLRHLGFPTRFVSGYLVQLRPDEPPRTGPPGAAADFTDLHAWAEVYVPGAGWVGLDPTSGLLAGEGHIPLAATPRSGGAAPIEGGLEPCEVDFSYTMDVVRVGDPPRASKPFPAGGAEALDVVGEAIDRRLGALGFTLTVGGEPTFVSETDRDAPEWNGEALGPTKKPLALDLMKRLAARWAPGAALHSAQGKWYPGESLPRWALGCYGRRDGRPVWTRDDLRGDETGNQGYLHSDGLRFLQALVAILGVDPRYIIEAYEDPGHFLTREAELPVNVTVADPQLADPEARHRLVEVFRRGLENPTGYVLPLQRGSWKSGPWPLRHGKLVLIPGDSPAGLRLPLESLPWAEESEREAWYERDPWEDAPPPVGTLGRRFGSVSPSSAPSPQKTQPQPLPAAHPPLVPGESAAWVVRTALCVQVRDGNLFVFLPPVRKADDWFALVAEVERAAAATGLRVILEGYTPPFGQDVFSFQVTPDPGVIEVNLPPAASSTEWKALLSDLWEQAAQVGLSPVKFLVGGQVVGSGGGCHWVLGGPTPGESPFLRRPDLLRSWVAYLNHHPSLSYAFSGLFIGPTSQAPRFDEANPSGLADLELAFAEVDGAAWVPPWLTDRIFRNLMVDGTGNTHRTELCIDKLFSPDRASGRLGLVEFRSFEMAPHRDLAWAQSQLLRALTLRFLEHPYREPLVRWGPALRDQWMLPAFVEADLAAVLADLDAVGLTFPREPFAAQGEFRFPLVGRLEFQGIEVEVRQALEPWPVMGEEGGTGGTVRYVDSSVERLQVRVTNMDPSRYCLACRGYRIPLTPLADGSLVGGLRFKAWRLASGLHPTVEATPQVVVDLVDLAAHRTVAGCTTWVAHPAGRNYDSPPVNAFEAEARRQARFRPEGQTPGPLEALPALVPPGEFPHTLSIHGHRQTPRS
jgi:uncharacterized protein (DUF2126 family)/transglutaminase-like putative cysteine protease